MFKILDEACSPTKGSKYSACIDLYSKIDCIIGAGETTVIPLGVSLDYDKFPIYVKNNMNRFYLQLEPRSSVRAKGLSAGTGIIDIDYENEIMIILQNPTTLNNMYVKNENGLAYSEYIQIKKGDKIAQIMLCEHKTYLFDIDTENKRIGGIGSTDK